MWLYENLVCRMIVEIFGVGFLIVIVVVVVMGDFKVFWFGCEFVVWLGFVFV